MSLRASRESNTEIKYHSARVCTQDCTPQRVIFLRVIRDQARSVPVDFEFPFSSEVIRLLVARTFCFIMPRERVSRDLSSSERKNPVDSIIRPADPIDRPQLRALNKID